jgi:prepilin-type N-terminal cleavage/methylation domain-containing protein
VPSKQDRGFSLVEVIVALGISLTVIGAIFELVEQSRRRFAAEPDIVDRQQRVRVAVEALSRDLLMARAVMPYRASGASADPPGTFKNDEATIVGEPRPGREPVARTYFLRRDASGSQLMRIEDDGNAVPVVAGVASLAFDYFGDAATGGADRCTPSDGGAALVPVAGPEFTDGPWCPASPGEQEFDADLLRIRKVAVRLRLAAQGGDAELRFEVAPRNRNHGR